MSDARVFVDEPPEGTNTGADDEDASGSEWSDSDDEVARGTQSDDEVFEETKTGASALDQAEEFKAQGTIKFKQHEYLASREMYAAALGAVGPPPYSPSEEELVKSCLLNRALCSLKLDKLPSTVDDCDKVLAMDPANVKGLFRKGLALATLAESVTKNEGPAAEIQQHLKDSRKALLLAAQLSPQEKQIRKLLAEVGRLLGNSEGDSDSTAQQRERERGQKARAEAAARASKAASEVEQAKALRLKKMAEQAARKKSEQQAAERTARAAAERKVREAAEKEAADMRARVAAKEAAHQTRMRHLRPEVRAEVAPGRPVSPPIPDEKRAEGRVRVRFYNNTPSAVQLFFIKAGTPKFMNDIEAGKRSGSFAVPGSRFNAKNAAGATFGIWTVTKQEKQSFFIVDPDFTSTNESTKPSPTASSAGRPGDRGSRDAWQGDSGSDDDQDDEDSDDDFDDSDDDSDDDDDDDDDGVSSWAKAQAQAKARQAAQAAARAATQAATQEKATKQRAAAARARQEAQKRAREAAEEEGNYKTAESAKEAGNRYLSKGEIAEAKACYSKAIALDPTVAAYYGNRAACLIKEERWDEALSDCTEAVRIDSQFGKGLIRAGVCQMRLGQLEAAKASFLAARRISLPPMGTKPFEEMAVRELRQLQTVEKVLPRVSELVCEEDWKEAKRMAASLWKDKCPGHPGLTSDYLQALIACRDWDEVKAVSQFAMKVQGQTPKLVTVRGQCLLYTGQIAPARQCFKKALQDDPDFKDAQVLLKNILKVDREKAAANELYKSGDFAAALDAYGAAIEIDKLNAAVNSTLHCNRANCYVKLGNWEEAAAEAGAAIDRNEAYSKAFALRGQARVQLNNYEDACADYERASELSPDSAEFKTALNEAKRQKQTEARVDLYQRLNLERSNARSIAASQIKKAYHKQALVWHPDKHSDKGIEGKKVAEQKFKAIGLAYAILSDANKKSRYDRGASIESLDGDSGGNDDPFGGGGFGGGFGGSPFGGHRYQRRSGGSPWG